MVSSISILHYSFSGFGGSFIFLASYVGTGLYFGERGQYAIATVSLGVPLGFLVYPLLMTSLIHLFKWRGALLILGALTLNGIPFGTIIWLASSAKKAQIERGVISNLGSQKSGIKASVTSIGRIHTSAFSSMVDLEEGESTLQLCREILQNKNFILFLCSLSLLMSAVTMVFNTLSDFCIELGLTRMDSAFLLTLFNIPSLCGRFLTSLLLRFTKIPSPYIFVVTLTIFGAILATLPLANNFLTTTIIILFSGLMQGPCTGIYTCVIIKLVGLNRSALAQGLSDTTYGVITVIVGYLGGKKLFETVISLMDCFLFHIIHIRLISCIQLSQLFFYHLRTDTDLKFYMKLIPRSYKLFRRVYPYLLLSSVCACWDTF